MISEKKGLQISWNKTHTFHVAQPSHSKVFTQEKWKQDHKKTWIKTSYGFIHNSLKMETAQVSILRRTSAQTLI